MKKNLVKTELNVINNKVSVMRIENCDYISLTDLAKYANSSDPSGVIRNWMSNKNSFEFYNLWEQLNNKDFNSVESHRIKIEEVGYNRFTMTPNRWKREFNAIGIVPSSGKYSKGTFAHPDIAFEFASWLSPEFKLYLIKEFARLKANESYQYKLEWSATRLLSKVNYTIHTDAIKEYIIPSLTEIQKQYVYAEEADVLNVALFGMTAKEWRENNPELARNSNIRDNADLLYLIVLNNLQNINADLIVKNVSQRERLIMLNESAKRQIKALYDNKSIKELELLQQKVNADYLASTKINRRLYENNCRFR